MPPFYFPGTAAIFLRSRTWLSDVAIANTVRRRLEDGEDFTIKSTWPGNHHYHVRPDGSGFRIMPVRLSPWQDGAGAWHVDLIPAT